VALLLLLDSGLLSQFSSCLVFLFLLFAGFATKRPRNEKRKLLIIDSLSIEAIDSEASLDLNHVLQ